MNWMLAHVFWFMVGAVIGGQVNRGIYRLAFAPRLIGPWSKPHEQSPPRRWLDRVPIVGWWGMRREAPVHGRGFWIRPMLIEIGMGIGLAALHWWEISGGLYPVDVAASAIDLKALYAQFAAHALLIVFMVVATFIDFDEQTIPDVVTVPGALIGLALAASLPMMRLPIEQTTPLGVTKIAHLRLTSPLPWPDWLDGSRGLIVGLALFAAWCVALLPGLWTTRRGRLKAIQYWFASLPRHGLTWVYLALIPVGWAGIAITWSMGGQYWESLLSSLVGMAFGGALVWSVRIIAGGALGQEAMGFGDVTLLAMIGVFVGWQSALIIFFMAPFFGVLIALAQWLVTRRKDIAYGPYLCMATVYLLIEWAEFWQWAARIFELGWLIPAIVAFCLALMGIMLVGLQILKSLLGLQIAEEERPSVSAGPSSRDRG